MGKAGGWEAGEQPVLLSSAVRSADSATPARPPDERRLGLVADLPRPIPKGWPVKPVLAEWTWLGQQRPPVAVVVAGSAGGVGTSTVSALLAETMAAASTGPTVLLDQCGTPWGGVTRLLFGQRFGLEGAAAMAQLRGNAPRSSILRSAPSSAAGASVLLDSGVPSPLRDVKVLIMSHGGGLVVDGGRVDAALPGRMDAAVVRPVAVLVGRADLAGAEATCAALHWLRSRMPVDPVVLLSSTAPGEGKQVTAGTRLVKTVTENVVHLPFDGRLAHGQEIRLDRVGKSTAAATARLVAAVRNVQEGLESVAPRRHPGR